MKSTVDAKAFSSALDKVSKVLRKSAIPAIEQIFVRFDGGCCTCVATDLITWLTVEIPAEGDSFSFVFTKTKDVVKACRFFEGALTLDLWKPTGIKKEHPNITLSCGRRTVEYSAYPGDDYLPLPQTADEDSFSANAEALLKRVERVAYAAGKNYGETGARPIQTCIQFNGNQIYALDGVRAACDADDGLIFPKAFLAPFDSIQHLRMFGNTQVRFRFCEKNTLITDGQASIICPAIKARPFNLQSAVPRQVTEEFCVQPKAFLAELKYLKECVAKTKNPYVDFSNGGMLMADGVQKCRTVVEMDGESKVPLRFNLYHMIDALKQFERERNVRVKVSGQISPLIIEAEGRSDYALVCLAKPREAAA